MAEIVICSIRSGKLMDGFRGLLSILSYPAGVNEVI
jgi:hypothetical protein